MYGLASGIAYDRRVVGIAEHIHRTSAKSFHPRIVSGNSVLIRRLGMKMIPYSRMLGNETKRAGERRFLVDIEEIVQRQHEQLADLSPAQLMIRKRPFPA